MNEFSQSSKDKIDTCHKDLQKILYLAIQRSHVDFGIIQGARTVEEQQEYFDKGNSKINPKSYPDLRALAKKAKHIVIEGDEYYGLSRAVDVKVAEKHDGEWLTFSVTHLSYIAGVMISCAYELYEKAEITHLLRWGGDWDSYGVIALDQKLDDYPHVELIKPI